MHKVYEFGKIKTCYTQLDELIQPQIRFQLNLKQEAKSP